MEFVENMVPGQMVTVYRDPIEETRREGYARLLECVEIRRGLQRWRVRFHPPYEEPLRKRFIAVLELDQKVGHGIARGRLS